MIKEHNMITHTVLPHSARTHSHYMTVWTVHCLANSVWWWHVCWTVYYMSHTCYCGWTYRLIFAVNISRERVGMSPCPCSRRHSSGECTVTMDDSAGEPRWACPHIRSGHTENGSDELLFGLKKRAQRQFNYGLTCRVTDFTLRFCLPPQPLFSFPP